VRGGSLENAVVLTKTGVMNPEGLRFPDEFCRHKILDLIGDLVMFGRPLIGHIIADRAGHAMHIALVSRLLRDKSAWKLLRAPHATPANSASEAAAIAASPAP
jgi:UDP-3-O-[3-hydroxymyristoyl] N-acetylglucosamine deacetylase